MRHRQGNFVFHRRFSNRRTEVMVNVWRLMAHNEECCHLPVIQWAKKTTGLPSGWGAVGKLTQAQYTAPGAIRVAARRIADQCNDEGARDFLWRATLGINLWNFHGGLGRFYPRVNDGPDKHRDAMQCGELVILKTNSGPRKGWKNSVVMRVTGPYKYVNPPQPLPCLADYGYQHQREAVRKDISLSAAVLKVP